MQMAAELKREIKSDWLIYEQIESDWLLIPIYFVVCINVTGEKVGYSRKSKQS
jgi:hypothetical protein